MNGFQIYTKPYSKFSLNKNGNTKVKSINFPQGIKSIFITNPNGLEISSNYGNFYHNSKKNMLDENYDINHFSYINSNNNNKNISLPLNSINESSIKQNANYKYKELPFNNQKNNLFNKKYETYTNKPKKEENSNIIKSINGIMLNKGNIKINIIPKKQNFKMVNVKDSLLLNLNKNIVKSISISKSKSKSKNKRENKSYNNKINNNLNNFIFDKYLRLYKVGRKEIINKAKTKDLKYLNKDYSNYNISKLSNEQSKSDINKMSSFSMANNDQFQGLIKKNKSTNLIITNLNKFKFKDFQDSKLKQSIANTKSQTNNNSIKQSNKNINNNSRIDNNYNENNFENLHNNKNYLTENHIMYLIDKKKVDNKNKNNKYKQLSLKDLNNNINLNINNNFNNIYIEKGHNEDNNKKIIFDYKNNNISIKNCQNNNFINNINYQNDKSYNTFKSLNERLNTEYNDNNSSESKNKKTLKEESNKKSNSSNKRDSFEYLHPEIYIKDDDLHKSKWNMKKEKELDETESPLKMDTDKNSNENSGVLSYDQVKDIICYYNMNNTDKKSNFLFQVNERQIFEINNKKKYLTFFFGDKTNDNNNKKKEYLYDFNFLNNNRNYKYPNSNSIFSIDTDNSSKVKK